MVRQLPPPHLKPAAPPSTPSPRFSSDLVVNHYVGDRLIPSIPGFRTSAAFLTSLSANLRLGDDEPMPSPMSTPPSMRGSTSSLPLPPPSPLAVSQTYSLSAPQSAGETSANPSNPSAENASDPLPPLSTYVAAEEDDRVDGLKLVADSVAQQRQLASRILIFHPLHLAAWVGVLAIVWQLIYKSKDDIFLLITTSAGITMAFLIAVRWATGGYLFLAEEIGWSWLGDDTLIVSKWGDEIIGALVLGWSDENTAKKKAGRGKRRGKALVRAWTTKLRYRRKGIGEALLEEAVKIAGEKGVEGIDFAEEHANSKRVLPSFYNAFLDKRDLRAEEALETVANEKGNFGKRR